MPALIRAHGQQWRGWPEEAMPATWAPEALPSETGEQYEDKPSEQWIDESEGPEALDQEPFGAQERGRQAKGNGGEEDPLAGPIPLPRRSCHVAVSRTSGVGRSPFGRLA